MERARKRVRTGTLDSPAKSKSSAASAAPTTNAPLPTEQVYIQDVTPQLDHGRYRIKRVVGDMLTVSCDLIRDGHVLLAGRLCYKGPSDADWRYEPLHEDWNDDRWFASFPLSEIGVWQYTIEAWIDTFASWRHDLERKVAAGQDVASDLLEGAQLVAAAAGRASNAERVELEQAAAMLKDASQPQPERAKYAENARLDELMRAHFDSSTAARHEHTYEVRVDRKAAALAAWYEFFPRSTSRVLGQHGTFRDAIGRLPQLADLGFDVIYLPPIHPIGVTNRKGRNNTLTPQPNDVGSPWAIGGPAGGHTAIEPALGTPEDFRAFVAEARKLGMEVALDYALQCSPDHPWIKEHPEWFYVRPDGTLKYAENPPKKYQDIYPLNFWCPGHEALWAACRDIFLHWIEQGVTTFRVDNPHTKPMAFWEWVIDQVQRQHPDTVFLAEAFTRPKRMQTLAKLGFTQSYTYFTWRNSADELREYLTELTQTEMKDYFRPNFFANTPDILHRYLVEGGRPAFRVRLVLAATLSTLYGIYSGFELCENTPLKPGSEEYLDSEKYEVRLRDYNAPGNINGDIARLNRLRREHPALQRFDNLSFHLSENNAVLFYRKSAPGDELLIAVNLDPHHAQETIVHVPLAEMGLNADASYTVEDLLTGARYVWHGARNYIRLEPQQQVAHVLKVYL